jgi:hypothetical protein
MVQAKLKGSIPSITFNLAGVNFPIFVLTDRHYLEVLKNINNPDFVVVLK